MAATAETRIAISLARKYPASIYFLLAFSVSWAAALSVALPRLLRHEPLPKLTGVLMFPAMLLGPSLCGILMTSWTAGSDGVRELYRRFGRWSVTPWWYALLLLPPVLVLGVLLVMRALISTDYAPNFFLLGVLFGVPAGFLEEIGWTGFAFHALSLRRSALAASFLLGVMWCLWHLPVINFLGSASPHGSYWFAYFCAFTAAMIPMRILICWAYINTRSALLAQLMHVSSTGALVIFSPPRADAVQEVRWYLVYAALLWLVAAVVIEKTGPSLRTSVEQNQNPAGAAMRTS